VGVTSPEHPRHDDQDDDRPDQGTQHATPVEDVGVTDPEADGEDEITDQGPDQAEPERYQSGLRPAHVLEGIAGDEHAGHDSAEQAEQDGSDHDYSSC
jgi:hypothetical protein